MQCKNCQKENIQIVSHYVELKEKHIPTLLALILGFGLFALIVGICLLLSAVFGGSGALSTSGLFIAGKYLAIGGLSATLVYGLIKSLIPYKHKTELIAVCLDCGHVEVLQTTEPAEPTKK